MGRVRFRGRDWVKSVFLDNNVDPGTCLTSQNDGDQMFAEPVVVLQANINALNFMRAAIGSQCKMIIS